MKEADSIQRFLFEHASIRGEIVHINNTYQTILNQRPYPDAIKKLLGEAIVSCILLAGSIKFEGEISLQFQGDERLPMLIVQCDNQLHVRAFATYRESASDSEYENAFLHGTMTININQYRHTKIYQSSVPIRSNSMSDNLMHYFAQSEQLSTLVWLATNETQAAGMLLQLLPGQNSLEREQFWEYAVTLGETMTENELLNLDNQTILHRLYHETELRLYTSRSIQFSCHCSIEKMQHILKVLGEEEIQALLQERGSIDISCDFCNKSYNFDAIDVTMLFKA